MITSIYDNSDPETVQRKAFDLLGPWAQIYFSTRKNKKYMIWDGSRFVHFGEAGMTDYTKHKDESRREKFLKRNHKWGEAEVLTPAWLSYYILW